MVKISGAKRVNERLTRMSGPDKIDLLNRALETAGEMIQTEAQRLITTGSVSGRFHVPSLPGEPPSNDTSHLKGNIRVALVEPLRVQVTSEASYASALEFGTSKMQARPYMFPATQNKRANVVKLVKSAVSITIKRGVR